MLAIDFGAHSIKAVKLSKSGNGFHLDNFGIVLTPPHSILHGEIKDVGAVSQALKKMLQKKNIHDRYGIIAITGQKVIVREITTPLMNEKELAEGIQWEAPKYVPYDLKESLLDAIKLDELEERDGNKLMKVLLVAAPKNIVTQPLEVLKNVRIQPKAVDIISNAHLRAFESYLTPVSASEEDGNKMDIILSMGASTTEISLIEGDRLKFTRTILKGGDDITRMIEEEFDIVYKEAEILKRRIGLPLPVDLEKRPEETDEVSDKNSVNQEESFPHEKEITELIKTGVYDIFNEIRKSLNYYKTQYQKVAYQRMILTGGMSAMSNIGHSLKQQFGITVVMANPLKNISVNDREINLEHLEKYKGALSTAMGLAKRER